jgi:hypothetical protein
MINFLLTIFDVLAIAQNYLQRKLSGDQFGFLGCFGLFWAVLGLLWATKICKCQVLLGNFVHSRALQLICLRQK